MSIPFLVLFFIPFGDAIVDDYRHSKLCKSEAGAFVYQRVALGDEFYLKLGVMVKKPFPDPNDPDRLFWQKIPASGTELDMEKLKAVFDISYPSADFDVSWGEVIKSEIVISKGDEILARKTDFIGGAGWFFEKFNVKQGPPGARCSVYKDGSLTRLDINGLVEETFYRNIN